MMSRRSFMKRCVWIGDAYTFDKEKFHKQIDELYDDMVTKKRIKFPPNGDQS